MNDKSFGFSRLLDARAKPGRPSWRCLDADLRRHLGAILYEEVDDPGLRAAPRCRLRATRVDRRALEMNLAAERGAPKMWEQTAIKLREEKERVRRQVGGPPEPAAQRLPGAG